MREHAFDIIKFAYGLVGIIGFIAYIPTIKDLYLHKKRSANRLSYVLWTLSTFIAMLYSFFVLNDFLFRLVSTLNFIACAITLLLVAMLSEKE
ncbi:MAG: hypothetical protein SH857_12455 [Chitinophagales bacterium]|nr:hypothetical protein [Chitinophagales bacterium]